MNCIFNGLQTRTSLTELTNRSTLLWQRLAAVD